MKFVDPWKGLVCQEWYNTGIEACWKHIADNLCNATHDSYDDNNNNDDDDDDDVMIFRFRVQWDLLLLILKVLLVFPS
jgi:hypothetical protein